jgi:head-tail adaptor
MSAPVLSRRLVLEAPDRVPDGAGGYSESWVALGHVWAEIVAPRGRAGSRCGCLTDEFRITVRAAPEGAPSRPTATMRFRDGARLYRIGAVSEADATGRYLVCIASEETGA